MVRTILAAVAWMAGVSASAAALRCELQGPTTAAASQAVSLQFALTNTGPQALWLLRWNTPWEGRWMAPFIEVSRDGQPLDYQGAMVKRAAPDATAYLHLAPGATLRAALALAPAFDTGRPGRYTLQPRITLGDVQLQQGSQGPRLGAEWAGQDLDCPALVIVRQAPR